MKVVSTLLSRARGSLDIANKKREINNRATWGTGSITSRAAEPTPVMRINFVVGPRLWMREFAGT